MTEPTPDVVVPDVYASAYHCLFCGAYSQQVPVSLHCGWPGTNGTTPLGQTKAHECGHCRKLTLWHCDQESYSGQDAIWTVVHPRAMTGALPHQDMPEDVRHIYNEARGIAAISARSACALLRLGLQLLVDGIAPGQGDISKKIGKLVELGLHEDAQMAMDVVRVVGNEAVHPGTIVVDDNPQLVAGLFMLINLVVEQVISRPKRLNELYAALPQDKVLAIQQRDRKTKADQAM